MSGPGNNGQSENGSGKAGRKKRVSRLRLVPDDTKNDPSNLDDLTPTFKGCVIIPLPKKKLHHNSKYKPEYIKMARSMCRMGATDEELAEAFGVTQSTVWSWRVQHPEFELATRLGKDEANARVERSLYQKATGYSFISEKLLQNKITGKVERVEVLVHVPPDTTAQIFFLKNRMPEQYREKHTIDHTGSIEGPITIANARQMFGDRVYRIAARIQEASLIEGPKDNR